MKRLSESFFWDEKLQLVHRHSLQNHPSHELPEMAPSDMRNSRWPTSQAFPSLSTALDVDIASSEGRFWRAP
jgi:hypothetical protein